MTPSLGKIPTVMTCKRALLWGVFLGVLATTTLAAQAAPSCEAWNTKEFGREVQRSHRGTGRVARRRSPRVQRGGTSQGERSPGDDASRAGAGAFQSEKRLRFRP